MDDKRISLDLIDQVSITRSFSKKIQISQYEPVDCFSSYTAVLKWGVSESDIMKVSSQLNRLAIAQVESDINSYYTSHKSPF